MSRLRRTIADRLQASWRDVPHIVGHREADASALLEARRLLASKAEHHVGLDALLVRSMVDVITDFPQFNAFVEGDTALHYAQVHLGIAVDTPGGLVVPVLRDVEGLGVLEIAQSLNSIISRAAAGRLMPDDMSGVTTTLSNIGAVGGGHVASVLPPRTSSLTSFGRIRPVVHLRHGAVIEVPTLPISVTADHRLIDGGPMMRYADRLIEAIEGADVEAMLSPARGQSCTEG